MSADAGATKAMRDYLETFYPPALDTHAWQAAYAAGQAAGYKLSQEDSIRIHRDGYAEGQAAERARIAEWLEAAPGVDGFLCEGPNDHGGHPHGRLNSPECIAAALREPR